MALTREQKIAALEDVLATGAVSTTFDGKSVGYRKRSDLLAELGRLRAEAAAETPGAAKRRRKVYLATRSGVQ